MPPGSATSLLDRLRDLALDLRWTWSHEADELWRQVDADTWDRSRNPWTLLQNIPATRLAVLAADPVFRGELQRLADARAAYLAGPDWFNSTYGTSALKGVAYFSMEFGVGEALPLYAGGLGVLAGDYLKTASDLGVPITGIGLLYSEGYFRQVIDAEGWQQETYPSNDPRYMPISPVCAADGTLLEISLGLPGRALVLRVWEARIGRLRLYLLDANNPNNSPADRGITARLYANGPEIRLLQELVLGIAGWRVIEALGIEAEICHLNEGHAAFVIIERARRFQRRSRLSFWEALWATRAGNVFTTHTPITAAFDRFSPALIATYERYLDNLQDGLGVSPSELLALGRVNPQDDSEPFNMAYLAMRGSARTIAVSRQHEGVSRRIFQPLFSRWPEQEVPVGHITNGVHVPSWDSAAADRLWTAACGKERWRSVTDSLSGNIARLSDEELWSMRNQGRDVLVAAARERLARQLVARGRPSTVTGIAGQVLDPNVLTLGFARRFTGYKRPNLLLDDATRLERLLNDTAHPAQLIVAGKAHPADEPGKRLIQAWIAFAQRPELRRRVVFLEDYDLALAQELVQGVDVWINTPRPLWEACGTSGMKVLVNGGLNLSVRDGWWEEAYSSEIGWAVGDGDALDEAGRDHRDAAELLEVLSSKIIPAFYRRNESGLPRDWLARIRRSLSRLTPAYSSNRMLQEHVEQFYVPAAEELHRRITDGGAASGQLHGWAQRLRNAWPHLHIGEPVIARAGSAWKFSSPVYLGEIDAAEVCVELFAEANEGGSPIVIGMERGPGIPGGRNSFVYAANAPADRPPQHYTTRIRPSRNGVRIPAELDLILWQK